MTFMRLVAALAAGALLVPGLARAQAGALDVAFSGDGKVLTNLTTGLDLGADVAVQSSDGKIVVAGPAGGLLAQGRIALLRLNPDGALDTSFGGDGKVFTNLSPKADWAGALELQPDGKIVVAGRSGSQGGMLVVLRYQADGGLDSTFSGDGKATVNFSGGDDLAFDVALQPDGMIVAVGRAGGAGGRLAVVRYTATGVLDSNFSGDGILLRDLTPGDDSLDNVVLQGDGKVVAAGTADQFTRQGRFAVIRLNAVGTPDSTFAGDGVAMTNFTGGFDGAFGVALQSDGRVVASGQAGSSVALARYDPDGALDGTFSSDGKVMTSLSPGIDFADEAVIQPDGKLVVAAAANSNRLDGKAAVVRYETNGALDTGFSGDGKAITNLTPGSDQAFGITLQPDGKIVTTGFGSGQGGRVAVLRYLGS